MLSSDSTTTKFYKRVEDAMFNHRWNVLHWPRNDYYRLADPTAMTALLDPSSIQQRHVYAIYEINIID